MTIVVFTGPTLRPAEVAAILPFAICLPPVAQGDVHRAALQRPRAIGIIDGYFSGAPSVWHKEILFALSEGVQVFGSASMGALRAAELHAFGMQGVGRIFEAFRDGVLEDDDEVAVVHGPPETGFIAASEPMVNMRATLDRAEAEAVISSETRSLLEAAAKALFFPRRTWPGVLKSLARQGLAESEIAGFKAWLPAGSVDRKREDALEMLAAMRDSVARGDAVRAEFRFERTHFWDRLVERSADERPGSQTTADADRLVLDELRLQGPDAYRQARKRAHLRLFSDREARRRGMAPGRESTAAAAAEVRTALGLFSRGQLESWIGENGLDTASYDRLIQAEAAVRALSEADRPFIASFLLDEMRLSGLYPGLAARAREKARRLAAAGWSETAASHADSTDVTQIRVWFFEERLGRMLPEDIETAAAGLGFASLAEFDRALRREWMYTRLTGRADPADRAGTNPPA